MKDEVKWRQKNLLRQVNLFLGLYTIGGTVFAYLCAQEPILIFFLIFLIPLGVICMLGLLIGLLLQMRKIEKVAVDKTAYRTWNTKVAKLLLSWIIIFIVGIAGGIQLGKYTVLRQENSLIVPLQKELTQKYHQAGFMGDIKVTKVGRDRTEAGSGYYGSYTYTEKLEPGKTYQKKLWVNFKPSELEQIDIGTKALRKGELDSRYQRSTESLVVLKESAAQQQPAVKVELKQIKQQFKTLFPKEKITNIGVCMYPFEETDPKFQKVAAVIAKNQQKNCLWVVTIIWISHNLSKRGYITTMLISQLKIHMLLILIVCENFLMLACRMEITACALKLSLRMLKMGLNCSSKMAKSSS